MKLLTIDSSVFVAVFDSSDTLYQRSKEFFDSIADREMRIVVPMLVLFEVSNTLVRKKKLEEP